MTNPIAGVIVPSLTPKKPQSQYLSRIPALFLSREMRNVAYILSGKGALPAVSLFI
jgi:hypothetical protein